MGIFCLGILTSCGFDPYGKNATSTIQIDVSGATQANGLALGASDSGDVNALSFPDSSLTTFTCYAINVVGEGIAASGGGNDSPASRLPNLLNGSSCAYPGVTSAPFTKNSANSSSQTISLSIPSGKDRIIQVVGIIDPSNSICSKSNPVGSQGDNNAPMVIVEVARVRTDIFASKSISIPNNWNGLANATKLTKLVNCGDPGSTISSLNPASISGLVQWNEANDFATNHPTECPTSVTSAWTGTIGSAMNPSSITCSNPAIAGLAAMNLNSGSSSFNLSTPPGSIQNSFTFAAVVKLTGSSGNATLFSLGSTYTANLVRSGSALVASVTSNSGSGTSTVTMASSTDAGELAIHMVRWDSSSLHYSNFFSSTTQQVGTTAGSAIGSINGSVNYALGPAASTRAFTMPEALLFNKKLSSEESKAVVNYLAAKYRISTSFLSNPFN